MRIAIAFILLSMPIGATTLPKLDLPHLVRSSEMIVHGQIAGRFCAWDTSHRFLWTHYTLQVADAMKGRPARSITISEPGGEADGLTMHIAGVPEYSVGEEVVVFLHRTPIGYWRCYGLMQGKYTVDSRGAIPARHGVSLEEFRRTIFREVRQ